MKDILPATVNCLIQVDQLKARLHDMLANTSYENNKDLNAAYEHCIHLETKFNRVLGRLKHEAPTTPRSS